MPSNRPRALFYFRQPLMGHGRSNPTMFARFHGPKVPNQFRVIAPFLYAFNLDGCHAKHGILEKLN